MPCSDDINRAVYDGIANARAAIARVSWFPRSLRLPFRIRVSPTWSSSVAKRNSVLLHAVLSTVLTVHRESSVSSTGVWRYTQTRFGPLVALTVFDPIAIAEELCGIMVLGVMLPLSRNYDESVCLAFRCQLNGWVWTRKLVPLTSDRYEKTNHGLHLRHAVLVRWDQQKMCLLKKCQ